MIKAILVFKLGKEADVRIRRYRVVEECIRDVERMEAFNHKYGEEIFKGVMWNAYEEEGT